MGKRSCSAAAPPCARITGCSSTGFGVDATLKVVGVGSAGTRCYIVLLLDEHDAPLFLQIKEAGVSVLERHHGPSPWKQNGERVVAGQRLMQAASDIFLGWARGPRGRDFYVR